MNIKTIQCLVPVALALTLGACDNLLVEDPASFLTTDTYYRTPAEVESGIEGAYGPLFSTFPGANGGFWIALGLASDQERVRTGARGAGPVTVSGMQWSAEYPAFIDEGWHNLYRLIYIVNVIIEKVDDVPMPDAKRNELLGEAKFLRGYSYFLLDKAFSAGNKPTDLSVPLLLTEADHLKATAIPRATTEEVDAAIIKDLTDAEAMLPTASERGVEGRGRATKGAAQTVLADLYLWRSSFLGTNEWQQASDWAKKVIDSGEYSLVTTGYFNIFNPGAKAANHEDVLFLVASGVPGGQNSEFLNVFGPHELGQNSGGGFGTNVPTEWMVSSFAKGDIRGVVGENTTPLSQPSDSFAYRDHGCSTLPNIGCRSFYPAISKFRPTSLTGEEGDVDVPLYRYAEVLLIYAEAQNELGNTDEAIRYVNLVRARARLGATGTENRAEPADLPMGMSKLAARDAIYMERNWELSHEGKRWWDLVRRDSEEPGYWFNSISQHDKDAMKGRPDLAQRTYLKRWPIPNREIDQIPVLEQNPGY
ncbi:MAG TPA: RagB/SusD family nutrient uptake outer membrane protein [Longimicrobiaceae bacterium]|nr:RagB/SusD family nutrient uptake outer membrane protein [Longimicrobiaceae bacterium]